MNNKASICGSALALLTVPASAHAGDFGFVIEPGLTIPLTAPQSELYDVGVSQSVKALFGLTKFLDIGQDCSAPPDVLHLGEGHRRLARELIENGGHALQPL